MSKHTPGPWKLDAGDLAMGGQIVLECRDCGPDEASQEEKRANVHLIAAAPELLDLATIAAALLRVAEHAIRGTSADTKGIDDINKYTGERLKTRRLSEALANCCDSLKTAIAKAEGRS